MSSVEFSAGYLIQMTMTRDQPSTARSETPTWMNMHLAQPSITTAWIEVLAESDVRSLRGGRIRAGFPMPIQAIVRDRGGVTFGMVRDVTDKIMAQPMFEHYVRDNKPIATRICFEVDEEVARFSTPLEEQLERFHGDFRF